MTNSQRTSILPPPRILTCGEGILFVLLAFVAVLISSVAAFAENVTLTGRVTPTDSGSGGLPTGVSIRDLTANDTLTVTATGAQLYFNTSVDLAVPITVSGFGDGTGAYHSTGKFRMQNSGTVVNLNGLVTLAGDTYIGSHSTTGNQGTLNFNTQITGAGGLITCVGTNGYVHLNNASPTNLNNYQGHTQLGYPEMYNYTSYRPYAGVVYLDANEQIPDALTAGASATGNLVMNSYTFDNGNSIDNQISKLYLGNHTETVNGLVSEDTGTALSVITGESGSKLTVGANNATASYSGLLQGAIQLEKIGTGTQTLSGANTYTGATTVSAGTLKLTNSSTMGTGTATVASGATVEIATDSSASSAWTWGGGNIGGAGTLKVTGGGEFEMSISKMKISNGSIIADGTHLTLSEASGAYHISGLTINVNNGGTVEFARTSDSYVGLYFDNTLHINFDQNGGGTLNTGDEGNSYLNFISNSQITFTTNGGATNYITGTNGINTHHYNLNFDVAKGTAASGVDLEVSAILWNGKGIVKNGAGTMALTYDNTYTGGTTINAGTLKLTGDGSLGTGAVTNNATLEFASDNAATVSNNISGTGNITKTGTGTLTVSGTNTYTGTTAINAGTLKLTDSSTMGTGTATVASGATVEIGTDSNTAWTWGGGTINGAGTLKVTGGGTFSITPTAMQIANNGSLVVDGANIILNNSANATAYYSGAEIYINNGGSVTFSRSGSKDQFWISNQTTITFDQSGGGTFNTGSETSLNLVNNTSNKFVTTGGATNYITGTNGFNLNSGSITFDVAKGTSANGVDLMVSAKLWNSSKTGAVIKDGAGTMVISGDSNNYKGATTINAGTLKLSGSGKFGNGNGVVTIASGATLTFADDLTQTTIANPISGAGKIVKDGTNTVKLNGRLNGNSDPSYSAFTGNMEIQGGKVSVLMNSDSNYFKVTELSGSGDLEIRLASGPGNSYLPNVTSNNFTGKIILEKEGNRNGNKLNTDGKSYEGFTFVVNPDTTLFVSGAEFKGKIILNGNGNSENRGALRVNTPVSGDITVMSNSLIGCDWTVGVTYLVNGAITSGAQTGEVTVQLNTSSNDSSLGLTGNISDGTAGSKLGVEIVNGTTPHILSGNLSYTGATTINANAALKLTGAGSNLDDSRAVIVNGTLNFSDYTGTDAMQLNNLSGTNGVIVGTGKDLILSNSEMTKFIGSITAKTITKTGDGTMQIYTGAEGQVDAQSLVVSSGNLDFKGYMTGGITVDANTIFSPGNSVGEATFGGGYILNDGATLLIEQDATGMDKLTASSFEIHPNSILDLTLGSVQSGEYVILEQKNGDTPVDFGVVTIGGQTYDYSDASFWNSLLSEDDAYYWNLSVNGNKVMASMDANAVPEPSTWALLILGAAGLLYWRKRKNA